MSYTRILSRVQNEKWAIRPDMLATIVALLQARNAGDSSLLAPRSSVSPNPRRGLALTHFSGTSRVEMPTVEKQDTAPTVAVQNAPTTAVVFASGILGKHISAMEEDCAGGLSVDKLQAALLTAANDPGVKAIVLWLDTPGGVVTGIPETRDLVARIAQTKTIVAYCDSLCASAGYWIASACDYIYATRSADLGSIGVYSALLDISAYYAKEGVKVELFKQGTYKAAGFPGTSLTDEQRQEIQAGVDEIAATFKADVTASRPQIKPATMQGQCLMGEAAIKAHLADALVSDLTEVLADLAKIPA